MRIIKNPKQNYRDQLEEILRNEIKEKTPTDIGIIDLGSNMESGHYVVLENDKPIGVATMQSGDELFKLYVHPEYRNRHIAEKLITHIMAELKKNGAENLFIERTIQSYDFWQKFITNNKLNCQEVIGQLRIFIKLN